MSPTDKPLDMQHLSERYKELDRKKTIAETNLENSTRELEDLKRQARETYGTDDLENLKAMLQQMKDDNERKRAEYQQHILQIEDSLAEVQRQHDETLKGVPQP
jgi:hypothetical protein